MGRSYHGVRSGRAAVTLRRPQDDPVVEVVDVPGVGRAAYTESEWAHIEHMKESSSPTLLNELAVIHAFKVELDAKVCQHPDAPPLRVTTKRQEALFSE